RQRKMSEISNLRLLVEIVCRLLSADPPPMPFTDTEIAAHTILIENRFWSRRRPPLHLREKIREGQRFSGLAIELFFVRPAFKRPGEFSEESIAKLQYVR